MRFTWNREAAEQPLWVVCVVLLRASAAGWPAGFSEARGLPEAPSTGVWGRMLDVDSVPPVNTLSWSA